MTGDHPRSDGEALVLGRGQVTAVAATGAVMEAPGAPSGPTTSYGNFEFPIRGLAYRVPRRMKVTLSPKAEFAAPPGLDHLEHVPPMRPLLPRRR